VSVIRGAAFLKGNGTRFMAKAQSVATDTAHKLKLGELAARGVAPFAWLATQLMKNANLKLV
jgi:hypothetical protein